MWQKISFLFRALHSRNYRSYFIGQGISLVGTWMQRLAMSWLVYRLTQSAFYLGVAEFATQFSAFLVMPFAGALLDGWSIRRTLIVTQVLGLIQALILAVLTMSGSITLWQTLALCVFLGLINAFDMPGRQSFVVKLVNRKEDMANAIALNSSVFNFARLVGPSLAGVTIAFLGEAPCFFLNVVSFLPIIWILFSIRVEESVAGKQNGVGLFTVMKEGWKYAFSSAAIRAILSELTLISLVGMPYVVLMPVMAKEVLHGDSATLGFLMGASGVGALGGALYVGSREQVSGIEKTIVYSFLFFGIGFVLFSLSHSMMVSLPLMGITGFFMIVGWASSNTFLQSIVEDDKRSRLMSLYVMSFMGSAPIGSLGAGVLAEQIGASRTLFLCGLISFLGTLILAKPILAIGKIPDQGASQPALAVPGQAAAH